MSAISPPRRARTAAALAAASACAVLVPLTAGGASAAVSPTMHAVVHEDNTIALTFDDGTPVGSQARTPPTIPPGTYTIRVVDDALEHNFHISGPGVDQATTTGGTSSPTWTVTFQPGAEYRFQCDTHLDFMFGVFDTTGSGSSASTSSSSSSTSSSSSSSSSSTSSSTSSKGSSGVAALRGTLAGTLTAAGKATLLFGGKPVTRLRAGRYRVTVADKASSQGFVLRRSGAAPITVSGVPFVGTHSVTVDLRAGSWTFSTAAGTSKTLFSVTA